MFNTIWNFIVSQVSANQFLAGGAVLGAIGFLIAYLRALPNQIWIWVKRRFIIEIDIPDRDEIFQWLDLWLTKHKYQKKCRLLTVHSSRKRKEYGFNAIESTIDSRVRPEILLTPGPGMHYFFYKNRLIILRRERKDGADQKSSKLTLGFQETFNIKIFSRSRKLILDLLEECREIAHPKTDERVSIYVPAYGDWLRASKRMPRPIESVVLAGNLSEKLLADVQEFQLGEIWYNDRGIPYRRGYLLYGPPGNGKSSMVMALASSLHLDICVLNLSSNGLTDDRLNELMANLPSGAILLIEDIDCVFQQREKSDEKETITFSGLLNSIDGVLAGEGRILFMTTNHIEKLDSALIRPGRCDLWVAIANATTKQAERLFLRFFPGFKSEAVEFATHLEPDTSMATIQGHLLKNRESVYDALTSWNTKV